MKVSNMMSKYGNKVANQFIITDGARRVFQSYNSIIAVVENGQITLDEYYWNYSTTTAQYRNQFLGMTTDEIKRRIKDGSIKLANLN